ncbi:GPCR kinase, partial [Tanacetum coccineum]
MKPMLWTCQLSSSTRVEPSPATLNPVRIIPGPTSIVQQAKLLKEKVFILDSDGGTIPKTIHHKVIGDGGYGKDITVGAVMVLTNVSVFTHEFVALAATGKEAECLRNLIPEILIWPKLIVPISIHCNSVATLAKAYSQMYN